MNQMTAPIDRTTYEEQPLVLVVTKLLVPHAPQSGSLVPRNRLTGCLSEAMQSGHRLSLIAAPAGYGKTTLVSQWVQEVKSRKLEVAWLSLDSSDNHPGHFVRYLVAALAAACPKLAGLRHADSYVVELVLVTVLNALASIDKPLVLVLDDYHTITSPVAHGVMQSLIERLPDHVHIVLISREQPALALGRLRAMGKLTELSAADLSFTFEETAALLNDVMGLSLSDDDVAALVERTERWVAGLQLAALALKRSPPEHRRAVISQFDGRHRFVRDYLREEVFMRQDESAKSFLLQTSLLDRLNPQLCDAVTGRTDSNVMLAHLAQANLFVQQVDNPNVDSDDCGHRYRYHTLFATYLRESLRESHAERICELERRAATWHREHKRKLRGLGANAGQRTCDGDLGSLSRSHEPLSEREQEVIQLMADGLSNGEIAQRICVAPGTVKRHVHNIFNKLNAHNRADALARARHYTCTASAVPINPNINR